MNSDNFFIFYALRGVEILVVVLIVSAVVAMIEKILGVDQTPRHIVKQRELLRANAGAHEPAVNRPDITPLS